MGDGFGADRFGWTDDALAELRALRGWTEAAIERLELRYDPPSGVVGLPIRDETLFELGVVRYLPRPEQRNGRRKMQQPAGVERQLFPPPEALGDAGEVVLDEGEPDTVAAWSHGFAAVGVPGVAGWRPEYAARFSGRHWTVYVVGDCDDTGRDFAQRAAASLVEAGVDARLVELDPTRDDGYDLTDYLLEHGADALRELQAGAELYTPPDAAPWRSTPWPIFRDESPEEHRWLVEGLMPAGALAFVAGPPKKGKTWLGIGLALTIVAGRPLLGLYNADPAPVLYCALEGSRVGLRARIGALARGLGVDPDAGELDRLHMLYRPRPFDLVDLATAEWLLDEATRVDAALVIVDVLRAAARFRENDAEDFARVRDSLEPLLAAGRTALLLHHFGKLSDTQKERSPGERMAGTGAMYGALDVGLLITSSSDGARRMRVDVEARDFAAPEPLGVAITGSGSGEHGGFTYVDTATLELDVTAAGERDYVAELELLFVRDAVWRTGDELSDELEDAGRRAIEDAVAADTKAREAEGRPPRIVRWDPKTEGRAAPGKRSNARPYGSLAMYQETRLETRLAQEELTAFPVTNPVVNPGPLLRRGTGGPGLTAESVLPRPTGITPTEKPSTEEDLF